LQIHERAKQTEGVSINLFQKKDPPMADPDIH